MITAREALLKIETVLSVSENYLVDGGLELSPTELEHIKNMINVGLGDVNEIQN
jgi:hypothetical protein